MIEMEIEPVESVEILPENIGSLPSSEAAPLLNRAASRIDILRPKSEFWEGLKENLKGASAWIDAKKGEISSKTLRAVAGASLVATMVAACAKPPESPYLPTEAPRFTEVIPTEKPTEMPTLEPTPTVEPTATPTEMPLYSGPLLENAWYQGAKFEKLNRASVDMYIFDIFSTLVQKEQIPDSNITEYIWGFSVDGENYLYRVYQAPFVIPVPEGSELRMPYGYNIAETVVGQDYRIVFLGTNQELKEADWVREDMGGADQSAHDGWEILLNLRVDPLDQSRLENFFKTGNATGFTVDEKGIIDLRDVIIIGDI